MKRITIEVTQDNINRGQIGYAYGCPINLACRKVFKDGKDIFIGKDEIINDNNQVYKYMPIPTPKKMKKFIDKFDEFGKKSVKPTKFQLLVPESWLKPGVV